MHHVKLNREKISSNLGDYDTAYGEFNWNLIEREFYSEDGPAGANISYFAIDRHAKKSAMKNKIALRFRSMTKKDRNVSYANLATETNRFCHVLKGLSINKGDVVCLYLPRRPELFYCFYGALKLGAVVAPLFSAFGSSPVKDRIDIGQPKVLITTKWLYENRIDKIATEIDSVKNIILIDLASDGLEKDSRILSYLKLMEDSPCEPYTERMEKEDRALLHFTSGTTGKPKAVIHVHKAALSHFYSSWAALDLRKDDVYWCTADPGWVTGVSYGLIAPFLHGCSVLVDEEEFDVNRWYHLIQSESVSVCYTAPTAIRMMMKMGNELPSRYDFSSVRLMASVGEPLNPAAIEWGKKCLRLLIHDNWWQTETGSIMIANFRSMDLKIGSMGKPLPGLKVRVVIRQGHKLIDCKANQQGEIAIKTPWPSMFRGYLYMEERYQSSFVDEWYLSGDLAKVDEHGYFWFVGRADDVIKSAGHLIGPFELESALMRHPSVVEAAVIGKPDEILFEIVKAFVVLSSDEVRDESLLKDELMSFIRKEMGSAIAPREIEVVKNLPHTRSGKIMRRLLKARELGLPEGDTSSLEKL